MYFREVTNEERSKAWNNTLTPPQSSNSACFISNPALFDFDSDVVFICVDIEAFEKNHDIITEVGIASLDTRHLQELKPGQDGEHWKREIKSRHFRIKEYAHPHYVNKEHVVGCPDRFEFGVSEIISRADVPKTIWPMFSAPFCAKPDLLNTLTISNSDSRAVVLIGHDTKADIEYLRKLNFSLDYVDNILEIMDTASLFRALKHDLQPTGLGKMLWELNITGWNLHNAGNDATYTLQCLISICMRALDRDNNTPTVELRTEKATEENTELIRQEVMEWQPFSDDESDGGVPVHRVPRDRKSGSGQHSAAFGGPDNKPTVSPLSGPTTRSSKDKLVVSPPSLSPALSRHLQDKSEVNSAFDEAFDESLGHSKAKEVDRYEQMSYGLMD